MPFMQVVFSHKHHNAHVGGPSPSPMKDQGAVEGRLYSRAATSSGRNKPLAGAITRASFYYMDKFVLLVGNFALLCCFLQHCNDCIHGCVEGLIVIMNYIVSTLSLCLLFIS
jgi:hypothetical protein